MFSNFGELGLIIEIEHQLFIYYYSASYMTIVTLYIRHKDISLLYVYIEYVSYWQYLFFP